MKNKFSLYTDIELNRKIIKDIDRGVRITLGPTGKNGIILNPNNTINFISSGSNLIKNLDFEEHSANILLKLLEQASTKTFKISGQQTTTRHRMMAAAIIATAWRTYISNRENNNPTQTVTKSDFLNVKNNLFENLLQKHNVKGTKFDDHVKNTS